MQTGINDGIWKYSSSLGEIHHGGSCMDSDCFYISKRRDENAGLYGRFENNLFPKIKKKTLEIFFR